MAKIYVNKNGFLNLSDGILATFVEYQSNDRSVDFDGLGERNLIELKEGFFKIDSNLNITRPASATEKIVYLVEGKLPN